MMDKDLRLTRRIAGHTCASSATGYWRAAPLPQADADSKEVVKREVDVINWRRKLVAEGRLCKDRVVAESQLAKDRGDEGVPSKASLVEMRVDDRQPQEVTPSGIVKPLGTKDKREEWEIHVDDLQPHKVKFSSIVELLNTWVQIEREELKDEREEPIPHLHSDQEIVGLACSGGGIRSSAFCLGVFQGLDSIIPNNAEPQVLDAVDYLSTVSGGGYIATSVAAGMKRTQGRFPFESKLDAQETLETKHIRDHSNYLAP